jgi:prepilin-type N-terminal cleavage/methylation domain-containing protein/prepilin-type processing-associated H-X9-DG protein
MRPSTGFTLIELLVVLAIIGILVGLLLPTMAAVRRRAIKVACMSNLRQIGLGIQMYTDRFGQVYPTARYMPPPLLSTDDDPPITKALRGELMASDGSEGARVFHCPGDSDVFALCGSSYMYQSELSGLKMQDFFPVKYFGVQPSQVVVMRDFDAGVFDLDQGGSVTQMSAPPFHELRNLLFGDGHVGNFTP